MYFWVAVFLLGDEGYSCAGVFKYSDPELAKKEFNLLVELGCILMYALSQGIPPDATLVSVYVGTFNH